MKTKMKTKMKTWTRVLLVCMTMSLFCVNVHSIEKPKALQMDCFELNILTTNKLLK